MNSLDHPSSATIEEAAKWEVRESAQNADTIQELVDNVRERVDALAYPYGGTVHVIEAKSRNSMRDALERQYKELEKAKEFGRIKLVDNLPQGVQGQTELENPDAAVVNRDLAEDPHELLRVSLHEGSKEVGHASHVAPDVPNQEVALINEGEEYDPTTIFEGYVEDGVAEKMGEAGQRRPGQPDDVYGKGQDLAEEMKTSTVVGANHWNRTLRETGRYGELQRKLWEDQVRRKPTEETAVRILDEAQRTGHHREAMEALMQFS